MLDAPAGTPDLVLPAPPAPTVAVAGTAARFPVRRVVCVGRNYAAHAREMGRDPDREPPFFFLEPAWANAGAGSTIRMAVELFQQMAGIETTGVGYRGGGPAIQGVPAGDARMIIMPAAGLVPHFQSGDLRPLAVTTRERSPVLPDVPTFAEPGCPGFEVVEHIAMLVPAGAPRPVVARLNAACAAALDDAPEVRERMAALTVTPGVRPVEEWPSYAAAETAKWRDLVQARNIRLQ